MELVRRDLVSEGNLSSQESDEMTMIESMLPVSALCSYQKIIVDECLKVNIKRFNFVESFLLRDIKYSYDLIRIFKKKQKKNNKTGIGVK